MSEFDPYDHMSAAGISMKEKSIDARQRGRFTTTVVGGKLTRESIPLLLKALEDFMDQPFAANSKHRRRVRMLLEEVGLEVAAAATIQLLADKLSWQHDEPLQRLRLSLGRELENDAAWRRLRAVDGVGYSYTIKDYQRATGAQKARLANRMRERLDRQAADLGWDRKDQTMLGATLIELAVAHCGIFEQTTGVPNSSKRTRKPHKVVRLRPAVFEWIRSGEEVLADRPRRLPLIEKPLPWGKGQVGGYDPLRVRQTAFCRFRDLSSSDMPGVYSAVNALQDTGYAINPTVRMALGHVIDKGWEAGSLNAAVPVKPVAPEGEYDRDCPKWDEYRRLRRAYSIRSKELQQAHLGASRSMWAADLYAGREFHHVHMIDFRGRCYPVAPDLSYQGQDYARALTSFSKLHPIGDGTDWFLITGANLFGQDKVTLAERIRWVRDNEHELGKIGQDPLTNRGWLEADKPFQALAWAEEFARFRHHGETFQSRLPIGQDGSNNGLQLMSLLLRDAEGGHATNCTPSAVPQDIYQIVADKTTKRLRGVTDHPRWARSILRLCEMMGHDGLPRAACKKPTMTLAYGSTAYACQNSLVSWYHDFVRGKNLSKAEEAFPGGDSYQALTWLGTLVWEALSETVVKAQEVMHWLRDASDIVSRTNAHIRWSTPLGLQCTQHYEKGRTKTINLQVGRRIKMSLWEGTGRVDPAKARQGFAPNYVHSLDAAAMMHTTNLLKAQGVDDFRMIHDDYAVHAAHAVKLASTLRYAFVDLFRHDLLQGLHGELSSLTAEEIPQPPARGSLDLGGLLTSDYFFA